MLDDTFYREPKSNLERLFNEVYELGKLNGALQEIGKRVDVHRKDEG